MTCLAIAASSVLVKLASLSHGSMICLSSEHGCYRANVLAVDSPRFQIASQLFFSFAASMIVVAASTVGDIVGDPLGSAAVMLSDL